MRDRLQAGKNESADGVDKYAIAQYYENLAKEQYAGNYRPSLNVLDTSRDLANPRLNAELLKGRLEITEHFRYRYGEAHTYWFHTMMRNTFKHVNKYKFNYLLKAFFVYYTLNRYQHYRYVDSVAFLDRS